MYAFAALNDKQLEVLSWVGDGASADQYEGFAHRVVARALHNRRLIEVKGRGLNWQATLTPAGSYYLEHHDYPPPANQAAVETTGPKSNAETVETKLPKAQISVAPERTTPRKPKLPKLKPLGVAAQLMQDLAEAEAHRLVMPMAEGGKLQRRARMAEKAGLIPEGMQITVNHELVSQERMTLVSLIPLPEWRTRTLTPVHVPRSLRNPMDIIEQLQESEHFPVQGTPRTRALRLVEALVGAARERGMTVSVRQYSRHQDRYGRHFDTPQDVLELRLQDDSFQLRFTQAMVQVPREPTERELARARRGYLFPDFDEVPSDDLGVVLDGKGGTFWASNWSDTEDTKLEDHLSQVLEEIRLRHEALEDARVQEQERYRRRREEEEAKRQQDAINRGNALLRYHAHAIDEAARDQAKRWREAQKLRDYAEAVRQQALSREDKELRAQSLAWAERILSVAARIDPFPDNACPPKSVPSPSKEELAPFYEDSDS